MEIGHDGCGSYLTLFRKIKEQENKYKAQSWIGVWGLADWMLCVSCQMETLQEHES